VSIYNPETPGVLPSPYYWWESGGMFGGLIEYWHYTGDGTYNDLVAKAILSQIGAGNNFSMPQCEGNDDQGWWALTVMSAAEYGFPPPSGAPSWLSLAENVFTDLKSRWDTSRCNGGMKWKIDPSVDGYHYKSTIANGLFFQLAARLARFTGNSDYLSWAEKSWDWVSSVGLIDNKYNVYDGTDDSKGTGCIDVDHDQWSYNLGVFLYGAAVLQEYTGDSKWSDRTSGLLGSVGTFLDSNILYENKCEKDGSCDVDQQSFKAYLSRWLVATAVMIPSTRGNITPLILASATGAAVSCSGGSNNQICGSRWYTNNFDGISGVGQQLAALDIMHGLLVSVAPKPHTSRRKIRRFMA
jgi:mannan endo-1,6-alpha-mannosidase